MKVIKIEYFNDKEDGENTNFELFDNIEKAFNFIQVRGIDINLVEVNKENLYYEENGDLNYEDNSSLFDKELIDLENLSKETKKESLDKCKLKQFIIIDIYGDEFSYNCESKENAIECFNAENGKDRFDRVKL